jgi:hypothetical protein
MEKGMSRNILQKCKRKFYKNVKESLTNGSINVLWGRKKGRKCTEINTEIKRRIAAINAPEEWGRFV